MLPVRISIHALREEGDPTATSAPAWQPYFYPRPPRGGRRTFLILPRGMSLFLSTPSARRATGLDRGKSVLLDISIHALREEGDPLPGTLPLCDAQFLSTPSARRATEAVISFRRGVRISIHALREEGDIQGSFVHCSIENFYPRPPRGGRLRAKSTRPQRSSISIHALREEGDPRASFSSSFWI